jgi:hypothetical protein
MSDADSINQQRLKHIKNKTHRMKVKEKSFLKSLATVNVYLKSHKEVHDINTLECSNLNHE